MENISNKDKKLATASIAAVAAIINPHRLVINKGSKDGVKFSQRFTVYSLSAEEIIDPITKESLGHLEIIKGVGRVVHIQDRMSILQAESSGSDFIVSINPTFDNPRIGDKARPI